MSFLRGEVIPGAGQRESKGTELGYEHTDRGQQYTALPEDTEGRWWKIRLGR
jgi:hypothetical protein